MTTTVDSGTGTTPSPRPDVFGPLSTPPAGPATDAGVATTPAKRPDTLDDVTTVLVAPAQPSAPASTSRTFFGYATVGSDGTVGGPSGSPLTNSVMKTTQANGATDGTAINTALALGSVRLAPGSTYVIDTAIIIPSNCKFDISGVNP